MMSEEREENKYSAIIRKCHDVVNSISRKTHFISFEEQLNTADSNVPKRAVPLEQELEDLLRHLQSTHDCIQA